jgi:hypothetical protein
MKTLIMSLAFLLAVLQVSGQRKSKVDPKDAQIDTLTMVNKSLTLKLDSVSGELVKYYGVYSVIKEKILHYNFDPTRTAYLIDSIKARRDSTATLLALVPKSTSASDSLYMLLKESTMLKTKIDSIKTAWRMEKSAVPQEEIDKANAIASLKQLRDLLADKIITETEFITLKKKYLIKL